MKKTEGILRVIYWTAMGVVALVKVYDTCKEFNAKHKEEKINKAKENCINVEEAE